MLFPGQRQTWVRPGSDLGQAQVYLHVLAVVLAETFRQAVLELLKDNI